MRDTVRSFGLALLSLLTWTSTCCLAGLFVGPPAFAQTPDKVEVRAHLTVEGKMSPQAVPAVLWLDALNGPPLPFPPHGLYRLLQKDRRFLPHLLVVPMGSTVNFPNADPFFHNVFSLFDGKRFDLGLYEAGSSRNVYFTREGASYIFCNIHPEMSAVVLALPTPLYAIASAASSFVLTNVPPGDYMLHVWAEGVSEKDLAALTRRIHLTERLVDLGSQRLPPPPQDPRSHTNEFGQPYKPQPASSY